MGVGPTIIKANEAGRIDRPVLRPFHLEDMMREVRDATAAARAEAARIIEEAKTQAQVIRSKAGQEGRQAGMEEGLRQGRQAGRTEAFEAAAREFAGQHNNLVEACRRIIADLDAGRAEWEASARRDLIELAMAIARRVVSCVGQRDREAVLANLDEAVRLAGARSDLTVFVNPADFETAQRFATALVEARQEWKHVTVAPEPGVLPGGCRIQWRSGAVDARLETQLGRIEAELVGGPAAGGVSGGEASDS